MSSRKAVLKGKLPSGQVGPLGPDDIPADSGQNPLDRHQRAANQIRESEIDRSIAAVAAGIDGLAKSTRAKSAEQQAAWELAISEECASRDLSVETVLARLTEISSLITGLSAEATELKGIGPRVAVLEQQTQRDIRSIQLAIADAHGEDAAQHLAFGQEIERAQNRPQHHSAIPPAVPGSNPGTRTIDVWISPCDHIFSSIRVGYETLPTSPSAIELNVLRKKRQSASLEIDGAVDIDGKIIYWARQIGAWGHAKRVAHVVGATGGGEEDRELAVAVAVDDVTVTFGTDGAGASVVPNAAEVIDLVNINGESAALVRAAAGGDGTGDVGTQALANLTNGIADVSMLSADDFDVRSTASGGNLEAGESTIIADEALDQDNRIIREGELVVASLTTNHATAQDGSGGRLVFAFDPTT